MSYQPKPKQKKAPWTQTPKAQAVITQAARNKVAARIERQKSLRAKSVVSARKESYGTRIAAEARARGNKLTNPQRKKLLRRGLKRIRAKSPEQARRDRLYAPLAKWFKRAHPLCQCCIKRDNKADTAPTNDIHHAHGKVSALFFFFPWFRAVCRECHLWIEANKEAARAIGMLCQPGEFNTQATESVWLLKSKIGNCYVATADGESVSDSFSRKNPGVNYEVKLIE